MKEKKVMIGFAVVFTPFPPQTKGRHIYGGLSNIFPDSIGYGEGDGL